MRLIKLLIIVVLASTLQWGFAQSSPEEQPPVSLEQDPVKSIHLYPNPATEFVYIKLGQLPAQKVKLTLHTIIGNEIDIETEIVDEHELRVKVKDLASGYYLLAVKDNESKFRGSYKFVKR